MWQGPVLVVLLVSVILGVSWIVATQGGRQ